MFGLSGPRALAVRRRRPTQAAGPFQRLHGFGAGSDRAAHEAATSAEVGMAGYLPYPAVHAAAPAPVLGCSRGAPTTADPARQRLPAL
jgi:hypothetical protein